MDDEVVGAGAGVAARVVGGAAVVFGAGVRAGVVIKAVVVGAGVVIIAGDNFRTVVVGAGGQLTSRENVNSGLTRGVIYGFCIINGIAGVKTWEVKKSFREADSGRNDP